MYLYGSNLPDNKKIMHALTAIRGIGQKHAKIICTALGFGKNYYTYQLTESQISEICQIIEDRFLIEADLRKEINFNISRLVNISSYRGLRHSQGLPVRGQRTHSNGRTYKRLSKHHNKR